LPQLVVRGREALGVRLRALREDARLTGTAFAAKLGWPGSKVSKIEHGKQTPTAQDVSDWVAAAGGSEELRAELLADLRSVRLEHRTWSRLTRRGVAGRQRATAKLDATTTVLRAFEPAVIPGLLQTAEYARCVLEGVVALRELPNDVADGVRARMERQQALYEPGRQFHFLITEAALRYQVCPPEVMRGQLDRLLAVASLESVNLAVLPFEAHLPFPAVHGFWMYDDHLVLVDTVSAELALRDEDDIALYARLFERMSAAALHGASASRRIASVIEPASAEHA
jgi:transcriptional regulator with XRE-family HTH domain